MNSYSADQNPIVAIIMGSDSDWQTLSPASEILKDFGISFEVKVVSAHRMPEDMVEFAKSAVCRGLKVIIAGAGGSAHLPGMVASLTTIPVIGVPVPLKHLEGLDSLLSIVQMPAGVPVATVGIGNAKNAGLLAARIISTGNNQLASELQGKLSTFQKSLREVAIGKGDELTKKIKNLVSQDK